MKLPSGIFKLEFGVGLFIITWFSIATILLSTSKSDFSVLSVIPYIFALAFCFIGLKYIDDFIKERNHCDAEKFIIRSLFLWILITPVLTIWGALSNAVALSVQDIRVFFVYLHILLCVGFYIKDYEWPWWKIDKSTKLDNILANDESSTTEEEMPEFSSQSQIALSRNGDISNRLENGENIDFGARRGILSQTLFFTPFMIALLLASCYFIVSTLTWDWFTLGYTIFGAIVLCTNIVLIAYIRKKRITISENQVVISGLFKTKRIEWKEIREVIAVVGKKKTEKKKEIIALGLTFKQGESLWISSIILGLKRLSEIIAMKTNLKIEYTDYVRAWNLKGTGLDEGGHHAEAIECYDRSLKNNLRYVEALNNKGISLLNLGRFAEALQCLDKALEINPQYVEALNNKGISLNSLFRFAEALQCLDKALEINPQYVEALNNKGISLLNLGRFAEALQCLDKALEINPQYVETLGNKALTEDNLGKRQEAAKYYRKFIELAPAKYAQQITNFRERLRKIEEN